MPVLFAVDQFNSWESMSVYHFRDTALVLEIYVCLLLFLSYPKKDTVENWTLANGLCIAATSFKHSTDGGMATYQDCKSSMPLVVEVPEYSAAEFLSVLEHYNLGRCSRELRPAERHSYGCR